MGESKNRGESGDKVVGDKEAKWATPPALPAKPLSFLEQLVLDGCRWVFAIGTICIFDQFYTLILNFTAWTGSQPLSLVGEGGREGRVPNVIL